MRLLQVPEENIQSVIGALRPESAAQWRKLEKAMTTTISKVILFKKFIMSKKCQELASGLLWVNSERKDGGREEGDSVLGKPLLLNHFLYPPQLLFAFLRAQVPSTSTLW